MKSVEEGWMRSTSSPALWLKSINQVSPDSPFFWHAANEAPKRILPFCVFLLYKFAHFTNFCFFNNFWMIGWFINFCKHMHFAIFYNSGTSFSIIFVHIFFCCRWNVYFTSHTLLSVLYTRWVFCCFWVSCSIHEFLVFYGAVDGFCLDVKK